jgi:hypothetical protein
MNRQRLVLAALAAVLVASLCYAFWAMPRQEKAPPRPAVAKPAVSKGKPAKSEPAGKVDKQPKVSADRLQLELLNQEPRAFPGAGRDIFRFAGGAIAVAADVEPVEVVPPPPPPPKPPPTPEELLRGSVTNITFLGFLEKRATRTVFLTSGDDVYLVKAGERFGKNKELIAREITAKQLVVGWVDGPETVKVQLLENEKLQPAASSGGGSGGVTSAGPVGSLGARPGSIKIAPRRLLMPQRTTNQPPPPEEEPPPEVEAVEPPPEDISQEELLKQGLPSGEQR